MNWLSNLKKEVCDCIDAAARRYASSVVNKSSVTLLMSFDTKKNELLCHTYDNCQANKR